ncbi:unnamed protein product [Lactuca virosa]|uniref:Uncharacterized protein n=1 Tax=Lactuca virosa TaxID=75947 RepID=A0AAU9MJV3_9ASTR|nr:unnamed protein product [Lactuca virosa]
MLRRVDLQNSLLVQYLVSIDSTVSIGVLPSKGAEGSSKAAKVPKKKKQTEKPPTVVDEVSKEIILSKTGILKHTKKPAKRPHDSSVRSSVQESEIETTKQTQVDSSHTHSSQKGIKKIRKPQFNRRGVLFREVHVPVVPTSKKLQALDMAQKLQKKKSKHQDPLDQVTIEADNDSDSGRLDIQNDYSRHESPRRDSSLK